MAHTVRNKLRGLAAAFVAVMAALALVPGMAFASTINNWVDGSDQTVDVIIKGLNNEQDTVELKKVADVHFDQTTHEISLVPVGDQPADDFAAAVRAYATSGGSAVAATTLAGYESSFVDVNITPSIEDGTATFTGVDAGIYYVDITAAAGTDYTYQTNMFVSVTPKKDGASWTLEDAMLNAKGGSSQIDKKIVKVDGSNVGISGDDANAHMGSTYTFTVTFEIPRGRTSFTLTDVMSGFEYNLGSMALYEGNTASGDSVATGDTAVNFYTVTPSQDAEADNALHGFEMEFDDALLAGLDDNTIYTIQYTADLCEHALASGATNTAYTDLDKDGDKVTAEFGHVGLQKVDEKDNRLAGATFQLFSKNEKGDYVAVTDKDGNNVYLTSNGTQDVVWTDDVELDANSALLEIGDKLYLKETVAPVGYKKNDQYHEVTVVAMDDDNTPGYVKVANELAGPSEGVDLPQTGGMGTVAFTAAGVVIIAGAAACLVRCRKRD